MALPNTFVNGDVIDADETNENFNAVDATNEKYSDATGSTTAISGTHTVLSLTVGGGYSGIRPVYLSAKLYSAANIGFDVKILRNSGTSRFARRDIYSEWSVGNGNYSYPHDTIWVASGDTISIQLIHMGGTSGGNVTLSEIKCYCPDADLTLT